MRGAKVKIQRLLEGLSSSADIDYLLDAVRKRKRQIVLEARERVAAAREQAWDAVRLAKPGHYAATHRAAESVQIWVAPPKTKKARRQSVDLPRGALFTITAVQPRLKRIWLQRLDGGETYGLTPHELSLFGVRVYHDEMTAQIAAVGHQ